MRLIGSFASHEKFLPLGETVGCCAKRLWCSAGEDSPLLLEWYWHRERSRGPFPRVNVSVHCSDSLQTGLHNTISFLSLGIIVFVKQGYTRMTAKFFRNLKKITKDERCSVSDPSHSNHLFSQSHRISAHPSCSSLCPWLVRFPFCWGTRSDRKQRKRNNSNKHHVVFLRGRREKPSLTPQITNMLSCPYMNPSHYSHLRTRPSPLPTPSSMQLFLPQCRETCADIAARNHLHASVSSLEESEGELLCFWRTVGMRWYADHTRQGRSRRGVMMPGFMPDDTEWIVNESGRR